VITFDIPSFTIDFDNLLICHSDIAAHQIQNPRAAVFVYKDLLYQKHWKIDIFKKDFSGNKQATLKNYNKFSCFIVWKYQLIDQIRITKGEHEK